MDLSIRYKTGGPVHKALNIKTEADLDRLIDRMCINWNELPKIPFWGPLAGYTDSKCRRITAVSVLEARYLSRRPLTAEETNVIAHQMAKSYVTISYEPPVMLLATLIPEWLGRSTFRFPFYTPSKSFDPNYFPSKGTPLLRNTAARLQWHILRFGLYGLGAHIATTAVLSSYALTVRQYSFLTDSRLADLRDRVVKHVEARQQERRKHPNVPPPLPQMPPFTPEELPGVSEGDMPTFESPDESANEASSSDKPFSFASENSESGFYDESSSSSSNAHYSLPASRVQAFQKYQARAAEAAQAQKQAAEAAAASNASQYDRGYDMDGFEDDDYHDDASPVAPSERRKGWQTQAAAPGSAWDRVRAESAAGIGQRYQQQQWQQQQQAQRQEQGQTQPASRGPSLWARPPPPSPPRSQARPGDENQQTEGDYTFRSSDEKPNAREEAQKEFDAMLDRERSGDNDEETRRRRR